MIESIRSTLKLQCASTQDEEQQTHGERDSKCPRIDDNADEIGKFFALVDRIRDMNKILKQKRATFDPAEAKSIAAKNTEWKIQKSKSRWKPSFEWEDFSYGDMLFGGREPENNSGSASKEITKGDIGSGEGGKVCSSNKPDSLEALT